MAFIDATIKKDKKPKGTVAGASTDISTNPSYMYGAAGRGELGAEATAQFMAASELGIPMSESEKALGTEAYKKAYSKTRKTLPSVTTKSKTNFADRTVAGQQANSAGAFYGKAGTSNLGTDIAGNQILGTLGGRNVIGGNVSVDRTAGIPHDAMSQYMQFLSPQAILDRSKSTRDQLTRERQSQLDAIREKYKAKIEEEQAVGAEDLARQRSINLRAGLAGSDFGAAAKIGVRERTRKNVQAIEAGQDIELASALNDIETLAQNRISQEQSALQQGFTNMFQVQAYQQEQRQQAVDRISSLGKAGLDIATIKERDPELLNTLQTATGMGEVELEAIINNNKPAPAKIDYNWIAQGNMVYGYGLDPATGTIKQIQQQLDFEIPQDFAPTFADDGTLLMISKNFDPSKPIAEQVIAAGNYRKPFASELGGGTGSLTEGMTSKQTSTFNSIVDKYNKSPLIAASDRTIVLQNAVNEIEKNPNSGPLQLNLVYSYVQALDTYQSAVREGELALVNSIDSKIGQLQGSIQKIQNGQIVRPEVAKEIAAAAQKVINTINEGAKRKEDAFRSQASVNGIEQQWNSYISGFQQGYNAPVQSARDIAENAGYDYDAMIADGITDEEILNSL